MPTFRPPERLSLWARLRARVLRWYWRRYATAIDWQQPHVREAVGGDWELADAVVVSHDVRAHPGNATVALVKVVTAPYDRVRGEMWWRPRT